MITLVRSSVFDRWLGQLADAKGKARIIARLTSAERGNFGDCHPVGEGVRAAQLFLNRQCWPILLFSPHILIEKVCNFFRICCSETRIHFGPGYRVYFVRDGAAVYVLLCGGDKSSQRRDIGRAQEMAKDLREAGQ